MAKISKEQEEGLNKILAEKFPSMFVGNNGNKQIIKGSEIAIGDKVTYTLPDGSTDTIMYVVTDIDYTIQSSDGIIRKNIKGDEIDKQ
jgi:hypothetical protein